MTILKKIGITLLIISIIVLVFYLSYSAYGAFNRFDVEVSDSEFTSSDNTYKLSIRGERVIFSPPGSKSVVYQLALADRNLYTLTNAETKDFAMFCDGGNTIFIKSLRLYLYKIEVVQNGTN